MSVTLGEALRQAVQRLAARGIAEARPAAEVLLADLLGLPRPTLYLEAHRLLTAAQYAAYKARVTRRWHGEPVQYITGHQEFWSLEFEVTADVLIPRPESELLVEHGVRSVSQWCATWPQAVPYVLDVGTGSGALAISLAHALPQSRVWGSDIAPRALRVARRNAYRLGVASRVQWVCGDLLTPWRAGGRFALCVANLPYVTTAEWQQLPPEIRDHEPAHALLGGGGHGVELIRRLVMASPDILAPGGTLLLEVGWRQAPMVVEMVQQTGQFQTVGVWRDFAGIERVVWAVVPD